MENTSLVKLIILQQDIEEQQDLVEDFYMGPKQD